MAAAASTLALPRPTLTSSHLPSSSSSSSSSFFNGGTQHFKLCSISLTASVPKSNNARRNALIVHAAASGDYYATLGVPKSASGKEIKAAYRRLARQVGNSIGSISFFLWGLIMYGLFSNWNNWKIKFPQVLIRLVVMKKF